MRPFDQSPERGRSPSVGRVAGDVTVEGCREKEGSESRSWAEVRENREGVDVGVVEAVMAEGMGW